MACGHSILLKETFQVRIPAGSLLECWCGHASPDKGSTLLPRSLEHQLGGGRVVDRHGGGHPWNVRTSSWT